MALADAAKLKKEGNAAFGKAKYAEAVEKYTQAIDLWMDTHDRAVLYSNRSAARLKVRFFLVLAVIVLTQPNPNHMSNLPICVRVYAPTARG